MPTVDTYINDSKARVYAVASRIGTAFPEISTALVAEVENGAEKPYNAVRERDRMYTLATEAEQLQATLVLGLASTPKGNNINHDNLDNAPRRIDAIATLYQGR